jgi:hypothetical protein
VENGTASDMAADATLNIGDFVITTGYGTEGDGGDNYYEIVPNSTGTDDGGSFIDLAGSGHQAKGLFPGGVHNIKQWGATGDGVTDDSDAIQNALNYVKTGGVLTFPPADYFISKSVAPQYPSETPLQRAILVDAGSPTAGAIEDITIYAYGAKLVTAAGTFTSAFPFSNLGFVGVSRVSVFGLQFESDYGAQATGWFDSTNYFNQAAAANGTAALYFVRFTDIKIKDCVFEHMTVGLVCADDRNTIVYPAGESMESYRSIVSGCRFFNIAQALSMSTGSSAEMIVESNSFEYTFIKLVQETDQGRSVQIKNNTFTDIAGIMTNTNNTQIIGNTFNNLLGGITLQPSGDSTRNSTDYDYDLLGMIIKDNQCYSDHATAVLSGTAKPQGFIIIASSAAGVAAQTVNVDGLVISDNQVDIWPEGSSSTGSFLNRSGDADLVLKSIDIKDNQVTLNNANASIIALAGESLQVDTKLEGPIEISGNYFKRTTGNANFEFQMFSNTILATSSLTFNNNLIETNGTNRQVSIGNIGKLEAINNKFVLANVASSAISVFYTGSVPLINIQDNDVVRLAASGNTGYLLQFDGISTGVYDTILDQAVVRIKDNRLSNGQFIFSSLVSFQASSEGFYEIMGNLVRDNGADTSYSGSITLFTSENVVNPSKNNTPPVVTGIPSFYICWNGNTASAQNTGWIFNGTAWKTLGAHP